jgi:serine protease Do
MKNIVRYIIPMAGLAAFLPAILAQDVPPPDKKEMRVLAGPGGPDDNLPLPPPHHGRRMMFGGPGEMESVTFLGIATAPAGGALADQLELPKDAGLVVTTIMPDSPAAAVLKRHDVLVKLDDQLLIEQRQLSVLIRNHKEGDEITLTYIRLGKQETAKVKLGKHDMPKMAFLGQGAHGNMAFAFGSADAEAMAGMGRDDADRVLALIHRGEAPDGPGEQVFNLQAEHSDGPGMHSVSVNTSNSNMMFSDEQGSLDLTIKDGKKTLIAKNAKGEQLFSGPVTTPEERKALPADVRTRLDKLENMQEFSFKTDGDFTPGEVKDVRPLHQGIAMPQPPPPPASRPTPVF